MPWPDHHMTAHGNVVLIEPINRGDGLSLIAGMLVPAPPLETIFDGGDIEVL